MGEHLVSGIYLTTSPIDAGEPNTPYCDAPPGEVRLVVEKAGQRGEAGVVFEHLATAL